MLLLINSLRVPTPHWFLAIHLVDALTNNDNHALLQMGEHEHNLLQPPFCEALATVPKSKPQHHRFNVIPLSLFCE